MRVATGGRACVRACVRGLRAVPTSLQTSRTFLAPSKLPCLSPSSDSTAMIPPPPIPSYPIPCHPSGSTPFAAHGPHVMGSDLSPSGASRARAMMPHGSALACLARMPCLAAAAALALLISHVRAGPSHRPLPYHRPSPLPAVHCRTIHSLLSIFFSLPYRLTPHFPSRLILLADLLAIRLWAAWFFLFFATTTTTTNLAH